MSKFEPQIRAAERDAFCRYCDKRIDKGQTMFTWYSHRNQGMSIHLHLYCVLSMGNMVNRHLDGG